VKVAAIDDDWSGLRLVWRTEHRSLPRRQASGAFVSLTQAELMDARPASTGACPAAARSR
jgi:hypothetical protein